MSEFHFNVGQPGNIRLQPERGGGALYDVGCYPLRLARLLADREPIGGSRIGHGRTTSTWTWRPWSTSTTPVAC